MEFRTGILQLIESLLPLRELSQQSILCLSNMLRMDSMIMTCERCLHLTFHFLSEYSSTPETLFLAEALSPGSIPPEQWAQISLAWIQKVLALLALATSKPKGDAISLVWI